jgi:transcriptional regulator with XRE-family HTH domain
MLSRTQLRALRNTPVTVPGENRLRQARIAAGMTQKRLAALSGIPQPNLSLIENFVTTPRLPTIRRLTHIFGCTIDDLFPAPALEQAS